MEVDKDGFQDCLFLMLCSGNRADVKPVWGRKIYLLCSVTLWFNILSITFSPCSLLSFCLTTLAAKFLATSELGKRNFMNIYIRYVSPPTICTIYICFFSVLINYGLICPQPFLFDELFSSRRRRHRGMLIVVLNMKEVTGKQFLICLRNSLRERKEM